MRTLVRQKSRAVRGQTSHTATLPPPVGGWNARDAWANMRPTDAIALENWFPQTSYVEARGGFSSHATGMTGNGKTLAIYNGLNGTNAMFCTTASGTYNVTSAGAVGASVAARTNGKHQWTMFGDGTNNWLILCNGVDSPLYYDGTTWTAVTGATSPALTGITTSNLVAPFVSKGRLYFIEINSLSVWYLAAGAAGGALTEFDLGGVAKKGGYLMAGATWTIDAGDGPDDRIVFVTSEGEAIVYAGTNPGSAAAWTLVGVYEVGKPLGRRCLEKYGGDLLLITQNGTFPMSAAVQSATIDYKLALSFKIENAFTEAARSYGATFGWEAKLLPARNALLVNIPLAEDGDHEQYVMNTITKAWCKFKEWDAECFAVFNKELYFADGTAVYKAWVEDSDNGADILCYGKQAFGYLGRPGVLKLVKMMRTTLSVGGAYSTSYGIDVDFADTYMPPPSASSIPAAGVWGTSLWGVGLWGSEFVTVRDWASPSSYPGNAVSPKLKALREGSTGVRWMATDIIWEPGGPVG